MDGRKRKILKADDRSARFNALPVPATRPLTSGVDHWPAVTYAPNEPTLRTFTRNFRTRGVLLLEDKIDSKLLLPSTLDNLVGNREIKAIKREEGAENGGARCRREV